jgi:hypothetical protein
MKEVDPGAFPNRIMQCQKLNAKHGNKWPEYLENNSRKMENGLIQHTQYIHINLQYTCKVNNHIKIWLYMFTITVEGGPRK